MKYSSKIDWFQSINDSFLRALILGKSEEVLPDLLSQNEIKAQCIYIDPPYNNGDKLTFYSDSVRHEEWLDFMSSVCCNLFALLEETGSLWISIDDNEMHYLKVRCDEVLGREHFVTTIVWQMRDTRENRTAFSNNHEYILVYAKDPKRFAATRNLLPETKEILARYKNPDDDPRGPWQSISLNVQAGHGVESQFYSITTPSGRIVTPPQGRCWVYNRERMQREIEAGNVWFGENGDRVPRRKSFLCNRRGGLVPDTLWLSDQVGTNKDAKKQLIELGIDEENLFDTPKPETLVERVISIASDPGDLVIDAFVGSGTTAAVAHKMGRQYVCIDSSPEAFAYAGRRMNKVVQGDASGISKKTGWTGGGSFDEVIWG